MGKSSSRVQMWPPSPEGTPPDPFGEAVERYARSKSNVQDSDHSQRLARAMRTAMAAAATGFHAVATAATAGQGLPDLLEADPAAALSSAATPPPATTPRRLPGPRRGVVLAAAAVGLRLPSVAEVESLCGGSTQTSPLTSPRTRGASPAPALSPAEEGTDKDGGTRQAEDRSGAPFVDQHRRTDHDARGDAPIVFLHGVGVGILPYLPFIARLTSAFSGRPVLVLEVRPLLQHKL